jgi:hypothetical protein
MFRRLLGRAAPAQPDTSAWWREANALAGNPDRDRIAALRAQVEDAVKAPDIAELQEEMIDGLEGVLALVREPALPVIATQHRVIGQEVCHFIAPVSLIEEVDASGKLFATADRLVFAAGTVRQWPWHAIVVQVGRPVEPEIARQISVRLRIVLSRSTIQPCTKTSDRNSIAPGLLAQNILIRMKHHQQFLGIAA